MKQDMCVIPIRRDIPVSGADATGSPSGATGSLSAGACLDNWPSGQEGWKVDQPLDVTGILSRLRSERQQIEHAIRSMEESVRCQYRPDRSSAATRDRKRKN